MESGLAQQILSMLGLEAASYVLAEPQGVANQTWLCDDWVVRISKDPEYLEDLWTESVAVPAAVQEGLPTPKPIQFSLHAGEGVPPFSVYERVPARPLMLAGDLRDPAAFFRAYGAVLKNLHAIKAVPDPLGYLDKGWELDRGSMLELARGTELEAAISDLSHYSRDYAPCFVHQDLHAENVLVGPDEQPFLIDWGDAGIGDPAVDFRFVPARFLEDALEGYGGADHGLRARIALHMFDQFHYCRRTGRQFGPYGNCTWEEVRDLVLHTVAASPRSE